ncbi:protein SFI1 homolog isoform X1 [Pygocentrus nattereri]|uniref:Sfi1 spindle body domain-containing protein n=1 Tax=Pygocentrus nattereri TaxID=42514 RepID=A0A3B4E551_PYGNA|nr:protein SFI1 homolog isoform X1 [Pygocentrus nattereri]
MHTTRPQCGKPGSSGKKRMQPTPNCKITYRVGYTWNRGGRLKELRIRHLARKFLHLWIEKIFGRVTLSRAKSYYNKVILKKVLRAWRDEWWHARREWTLMIRADCHYKYVLYSKVYKAWCAYVSVHKEEKRRLQLAINFEERRRLRVFWDRWELYVEMRRLKFRMSEAAIKHQRLSLARWVWTVWQAAIQHRYAQHNQEDLALQLWATTVQNRAWMQWKSKCMQACGLREKEARAHLFYCRLLQRCCLHGWIRHIQHKRAKNLPKAIAGTVWHRSVVRRHWCVWRRALQCRQSERDKGQIADSLAQRATQRQAFSCWRDYVEMCLEKTKKEQTAIQHQQLQLVRMGFEGLALNVTHCQTHRINKNISVQHHRHTMMLRYWKLWQQCLEQTEERNFQSQMTTALNYHRVSVLRTYLQRWRQRCREHKHMKDLEMRADSCFARLILPHCMVSWIEFTAQSIEHRKRRETAELFHQQQIYSRAFYTLWGRYIDHRDQRLAEMMAVLHAERECVSRAWSKWLCRFMQHREDRLKQTQAQTLYSRTLLHKTLHQWRHNINAIHNSQRRFKQAEVHDGQRCMRGALSGWREYLEHRRQKTRRLTHIDEHYERRLLRNTLQAWKQHYMQTQHINQSAESCYQQHQQQLVRRMLCLWRRNVCVAVEEREKDRRAKCHYRHCLLSKVLFAWHERTALVVSRRHQQEEALREAKLHIHKVRKWAVLRRWRQQHIEVRQERLSQEKACRYHNSVLLRKTLRAWIVSTYQHKRYQVLKNRSSELHRLRVCQRFFICWKAQLQSKRREAELTELALWHWSLNLQAKVMCAWRQWVAECQRKQRRLAAAAQFYRDELLREGITHILRYTTHMNAFSSNMALHSHEQSSRRLQTVVRRCALRWKQRALCQPSRSTEMANKEDKPSKKSVSFCLPEDHGHKHEHAHHPVHSQTVEQRAEESIVNKLLMVRASRLQPRRADDLLHSPVKDLLQHPQPSSSWRLAGQTDTRSPSVPAPSLPVPSTPFSVPLPATEPQPPVPLLSTSLQLPVLALKAPVPAFRPDSAKNTFILSSTVSQGMLLPPSSFIAPRPQSKMKQTSSRHKDPSLLTPQDFTHWDLHGMSERLTLEQDDDGDENEVRVLVQATCDPTESLNKELLDIRLDLQRYQQDRNQLQIWRRLQKVMRNWLQTTGSDGETEERESILQELNELDTRISALSGNLTERKPTIICHAARVSIIEGKLLGSNSKT